MTKSEEDILQAIKLILKKGNRVEVAKENGNIVLIEIKRKVNIKRPL